MSQSFSHKAVLGNFQDILKEKRYIRVEEIVSGISSGVELLKSNVDLKDNDSIVNPLMTILSKAPQCSTKVVTLALSAVNHLSNHHLLSEEKLISLTEAMIQLLSTDEYGQGLSDDSQNHTTKEDIENIHVKFLQFCFQILSTRNVHYNQALFAKLLALFFRMHRTKGTNESQSALVAIQESKSFIFDTLRKVTMDKNNGITPVSTASTVAKSALLFFSDLAQILNSNDTNWMKVRNVDRCLAAELLEEILVQYADILLELDDFVTFLNEVFPPILTHFFQNSQKYRLVVRTFRITSVLCQQLSSLRLKAGCFSFMDSLTEITKDTGTLMWKRVLAFEVFKRICKDHQLLKEMFRLDAKFSADLLNKICSSVRFFIEKVITSEGIPQEFQHSVFQFKRLDKESTITTPFLGTVEECISNCIDCLLGLTESMGIIVTLNNSPDENSQLVCSQIIDCAWPSILVSLNSLLESCSNEDTVNTLLRDYLIIINTCNAVKNQPARDAFLTNLCKFSPTLLKSSHNLQTTNEDTSQTTLSKKSVLVAQTIVDVSQAIGENLGSSWAIVLQSFTDLNEFLIDYQKNCIMSRNTFLSDLKNITKSMESLMQSTRRYSDDDLYSFTKALSQFYTSTPAAEGGLFVAAQMLLTLKLNIERIHVVWEVVQQHMLQMIEDENSFIRQQGIYDIFSLIYEFFSLENRNLAEGDRDSDSASVASNDSRKDRIKDHIELDLFTLLLTISASVHVDSKQLMIENLTIVIEQFGELITSAWTIILTVLRATDSISKLIPIAFKSVQLIGGNIRYLTTDGLLEYMKTVEYFATQQVVDDFNISLVAISLLWNLSDFMVKSTLKDRKMDLFISLFTSLRKCVIDSRPEVRNAAVRTLLFAIASHGAELDLEAWGSVVQKVLIPVLKDMQDYSIKADRNEIHGAKQQNVYVHHSRNTEAKQWSETNCLAIENISRVVKEHAESLIQVPGFLEEGCQVLIGFIHASFSIQTAEIARIVITCMFDIFSAVKCEIRRILWDGLWPLWGNLVADACAGEKYISGNLLLQLIENFTELYRNLLNEDFLNHQDILELIDLAKKVLFSKPAANTISYPTPCQKAVLNLLVELSGFSDAIREEIFLVLCSFTDYIPKDNSVKEDPMPIEVSTVILGVIVNNIFDSACKDLQKALLIRLIKLLGAITVTRFVSTTTYDLWKSGINHFIQVSKNALPLFSELSGKDAESYWNAIADVLEAFLLPPRGTQLKLLEKGQQEEILMVSLLGGTLLQNAISSSPTIKERLLSILEKATYTAPRAISHESMLYLFKTVSIASQYLAEKDEHSISKEKESVIEVGLFATPIIYNRCKEMVERYISDDEQSGEMPLPSYRRQEIVHIFQQIKEQRLHSQLSQALPANNNKLNFELMNGPKGLLIRLFPLLSKFTRSSIQDASLKALLCDLLSILSEEFGFIQ